MPAILRTILIALALSFVPLVNTFAGPYEDGMEAAKRGDYETALRIFRSLVDEGDPQGQTGLGRMYHNGWGVPQDYKEAANWYRKAAEQGDPLAQSNLGLMYDDGRGVPQDQAEAVKWYRKAAEQGYAEPQFNLGNRQSRRDRRGTQKDQYTDRR